MPHNTFNALQDFKLAGGKTGKLYSLAALEKARLGRISRLPVSIRIVLESVLRNCDGKKVTEEHVEYQKRWHSRLGWRHEVFYRIRESINNLSDETLNNLCDKAAQLPEEKRTVAGFSGRRSGINHPSCLMSQRCSSRDPGYS